MIVTYLKRQFHEYILGAKKPKDFLAFPLGGFGFLPLYFVENRLIGVISVITYILVTLLSVTHPVYLSKMYYLCPMSGEERKKLLRDSYIFRCAFHYLFFLISIILIAVFSVTNVFSLAFLLLSSLIYTCVINFHGIKTKGGYVVLEIFAFLFVWLCITAIGDGGVITKTEYEILAVCYAVLIFIMIPVFAVIMKAVFKEINKSAYYDEVMNI